MKTLGLLFSATLLCACGSSSSDDASAGAAGSGPALADAGADVGTLATYPTSGIPFRLALDEQSGLLWVVYSTATSSGVDAIDTKAGARAGSVTLPSEPTSIAVDPSNGTVVVARDDTVTWFRGVSAADEQTMSTDGQPVISVAADSGKAYVVTRPATYADAALAFVAPETGAAATRITVGTMLFPFDVAVDHDAHALTLLSRKLSGSAFEFETIDLGSQTISNVALDGYPWREAVVDGKFWVVTADQDAFTLKIPGKSDVALPSIPPRVISACPGGVVVFGENAADEPVYYVARDDGSVSKPRAQPLDTGRSVFAGTRVDASGTLFVLTQKGTDPDPYASKLSLEL